MSSKLASVFESIPMLRTQLGLAARRSGFDGPVSRRLRELRDRFDEVADAANQCDPERYEDIVGLFSEVAQVDRQYGLRIAEGVAASRKSLGKVVKKSPNAPLPGTVPTWAAVLEPEYLNGVRAELRERAASCV